MATDEKLDQILEELAAIKQALAAPPAKVPEKIDLSREEVMAILGFEPHQLNAFYQYAWKIGLKPYRQKHYRKCDVMEYMARAAFKRANPKRRVN